MMMSRIVNVTLMSIVIEDLGLHLQPKGGEKSCAIVRTDVAARSSDLRRHAKWVKIEEFEVLAPSHQNPPIQSLIRRAAPVSEAVVKPAEMDSDMEIKQLRKSMDDMKGRQEELIALCKSAMTQVPEAQIPVSATRVRETPVRVFSPDLSVEEPIILPALRVPDRVELSNVRTKENETSGESFDTTLKALKKAKKR